MRRIRLFALAFSLLCFCFTGAVLSSFLFVNTAQAQVKMRMLLTSNIQGKSYLESENQEEADPLLVLAQSIMAEKKKGADIYLDLGNAFYPGVLSKFSSGSIMMDFLDDFSCAATLVSSKDLQIGLKNLEFLQKDRNVRLLSANITRPAEPVFHPYLIAEIKTIPIAFIGISSRQLKFDIAEKDLYALSLKDEKEALEPVLKEIKDAGITHVVLLSGLKLNLTVQLLETFKQIDMALCGGDYTGALFDGKASRIDLADGRSIVTMDDNYDYFVLDVTVNDRLALDGLSARKAHPQKTFDLKYLEFADRLSLWKQKYRADQNQSVASITGKEYILDDLRISQLLRDRFNCEIALVSQKTISRYPIKKDILQSDLLHLVNLDFNIFTFLLTGDQLTRIAKSDSGLVQSGLEEKEKVTVQGYPVEGQRTYSIAATQPAFEKIEQLLGTEIPFHNTWQTVTDLLVADLKGKQITLRDDDSYLDKRFRTLVDIYLSNFIATGDVSNDDGNTPVDQPSASYSKWGLEDRIDLTFYNQNHRFVLSPYLLYTRQDQDYINNLLRGTLLYDYNFDSYLRPYNKLQADSVVEEIDGQRPIMIRETAGISAYKNFFNWKLGLGFEKKVQDPSDDAIYGIETIVGIEYPFFKYLTYSFNIDNFVSVRNWDSGRWGLRSEINNAISARINDYLSFSLKHKYFYLHEDESESDYRSSQFLTTIDLKTNWKIW